MKLILGPTLAGEQVAKQRVGRGRAAGFADADAEAHGEQRPEIPGQAAHGRQDSSQTAL